MGVFDGIFRSLSATPGGKFARTDANVANKISAYLAKKWPELTTVPGLWFSGSTVWSFLYGEEPRPDADLDVFALEGAPPVVTYSADATFFGNTTTARTPIGEMLHRLGLKPEEGRTKNAEGKPHYHVNGADFTHPERGEIDVWTSSGSSAAAVLRQYPGESHGHCRAAFSFTDGLVVLPNEQAK